ncbi:MAG: arylsulfotransferase family protein [Actinomycetota bacterium]
MDRLRFLSLGLLGVASPRSVLDLLTAPRYRSRPDLDPARVHVISAPRRTASGAIFVSNTNGEGQPGPMIIDDLGELIWFEPRPGLAVMNFGHHTLDGKQVIAWWEGNLDNGHGSGEYVVLDTSYRELTRVRAGNGLAADLHEFVITPQNTAILTAYAPSADGTLLDSIVQEVDVRSGAVLLEWRASDHIAPDESYAEQPSSGVWDFAHLNAAALDTDGNILVSSRHAWTIYKVDRTTGATIWRLGGKRSDFVLDPAAQFAWQHHVRRHADGSLTVFDNGAGVFDTEAYSRGVRLTLDESAGKATLQQQLAHPDKLLASAMGSMEPLDDGGAFVGWGSASRFSEFAADGTLRFDAGYPAGGFTYRAFRHDWTASPTGAPALAVAGGAGWASWNGATAIATWRLHAGPSKTSLEPVQDVVKRSFETKLPLPRGARWVRADALDTKGRVIGRSAAVKA